jgi:succinate-semialdehyde dehydrogenase/glutarate-semialdehyde dehydrogenase
MKYVAIDPHTGREGSSYPTPSSGEVTRSLETAERSFESWKRTSFDERARVLRSAATILRSGVAEHARLIAQEMGKPINSGRPEVEKCALTCDFYADNAAAMLTDEVVSTEARMSCVAYRPLGPIFAIMPWNYPYWQVFRFAAPALMAGNTVLLKHAENVPGCALRLVDVFREAGLPDGVFQNLFVTKAQAATVIRNRRVRGVTLTGSVRAGKSVAKTAGAHLKKTVLELGGSDPYLILEDADVEHAAAQCVRSRLSNSGQSCIAAKRLIVVEPLRKRFTEAVVERMRAAHVGNPLDTHTEVGPLAREDLRANLHAQVEGSVAKGARVLLGGQLPSGAGWYYPTTVLDEVRRGTPAYREELFGPVASILAVRDRKAAIRVANDTSFGLGAAVFTADIQEGERIAREELNAGCAFVNSFVRSDPRLPFGGTMDSGYGRELGRHGILEFVNTKMVQVA